MELAVAHARLTALDIFKTADAAVDVADGGKPGDVKIDLSVDEKGAYMLSTGAFVQGGEANTEASWTMRNALGNAEKVQGTFSIGHKYSNTFKVEATQPASFGSTAMYNCSVFQSVANLTKHSSYRERQRGVSLSLTDVESPHSLAYEATWRTPMPGKGSFAAVPTESAHSFKSSLKHTYTLDSR